MHRRSLLTGAAILGAQSLVLPLTHVWALAKADAKPQLARRRVRPGDAEWPSAAAWTQLSAEVGGQLIKPPTLLDPCARDANSAECKDVIANLRNPLYIGDQPSGTQVSGWVDAWQPAASAYVVAVRNAADVAAAVNFARKHNMRLVVKGGGHS